MATILLTKPIVIAETDDAPAMDLGVITLTREGISWHVNKQPIYIATWEQWALQTMMQSGGTHAASD